MDNMLLIIQYALIPLIVFAPALVILLAIKIITLPFRRTNRNEENAHYHRSRSDVQREVHRPLPEKRMQKETDQRSSVSW